MAIQLNEASELLMSIALFVASLVIVRYTRGRIRDLPKEDKRLGRPLYGYAIGVSVMGIASLMNYVSVILETQMTVLLYISLAIVAPIIVSTAALIVLGRGQLILPLVFSIGLIGAVVLAPFIANLDQLRVYAGIISALLYVPAFLLFGYIFFRTTRATSLGLFYLVIFYPLYPVTLIALPPFPIDLLSLVVGLRLFGPAIAAAAFQVRDIGISIELAGYGMAYGLIAFWFSYMMVTPVTDPVAILSLTLMALGSTIGFGTGSYTYARWKKSKLGGTFALFLSFTFATWSFVLVALQGVDLATQYYYTYAYIILSFLSVMCFNLAAYLALEWRSLLLLPVLTVIPLFAYLATLYPAEPRTNPLFIPAITITGIVGALVPIVLYIYLWQRMRHALAPSASRPLLLAMGLVEFTAGMALGPIILPDELLNVANPVSGVLILAAFLAWWLAVTGRTESFTKWWYSRTTKPKQTTSSPTHAETTSHAGDA